MLKIFKKAISSKYCDYLIFLVKELHGKSNQYIKTNLFDLFLIIFN